MNSVAEDVLLLLLHDDSGRRVVGWEPIDRAVAGAVLIDLAHARRLDAVTHGGGFPEDRLVVSEPARTGIHVLDDALRRVGRRSALAPALAVSGLGRTARRANLSRLVERNLVTRQRSRRLALLPVTSYRCTAGDQRDSLRSDLRRLLLTDVASDFHSAAVLALVHLAGGTESVLGPDFVDPERLDELTLATWAHRSIRPAVVAVIDGVRTTVGMSHARSLAAAPYTYW